ncbi:MAG TPA: hypothetical protein V6C65_40375, partial [Allocoleopsis sp.]
MNNFLRTIPPQFRTLVKRLSYFFVGTGLTFFYAQLVQAQTASSSAPVRTPYSAATIIAALIAAVITVLFLRGMYLVLTYASETYGFDDDDEHLNSKENDALLWGAGFWIVGSAILIASYGWGSGFLYLGPIICLLGPIVPIVAMNVDIKKYRKVLAERAA